MNKIPTLKPIEINYEDDYLLKGILDDDFFDMVSEVNKNTILDIFDTCLDEKAEELELLDSQFFKLSQERKYLNFISDVFFENDKKCILNIKYDMKDYDLLIRYINDLDVIDRYLLLEQFGSLKKCSSTFFLVDNLNLLEMFVKGILREVFDMEIYFKRKPLLLFSNYDLSLPLVFSSEKDMMYYEVLARNNNLYFR